VNHRVLAYLRTLDREQVLVVCNLASTAQAVQLDLAEQAGALPIEMFGKSVFPRIGTSPYVLTLGPYEFFWFNSSGSSSGGCRRVHEWRSPACSLTNSSRNSWRWARWTSWSASPR